MKKNKELRQDETLKENNEATEQVLKDSTEPLQEEKKGKKEKKTKKEGKPKKEKKEGKPKKEKKAKKVKNRSKWTLKYFKKYSGRAKNDFMKFIKDDFNTAIMRAERLSSINRNAYDKPVIITIPDSFNNKDKVHYRLDKNTDGSFTQIYDQSLVTILFFGEDGLFYYQANIDHRIGHIGFDVAGEFNYFDVVHMETQIKYDNPERPKYIMLDLEVGLSDGTIVPFHLRNHRIHEDYDLPEILTQTEQQILDLFKSKVRKQKSI